MTVEAERRTLIALQPARRARAKLEAAETTARVRVVDYVDSALEAGWKWDRIGAELGVSATGVRRYYQRNRRKTHGGDI